MSSRSSHSFSKSKAKMGSRSSHSFSKLGARTCAWLPAASKSRLQPTHGTRHLDGIPRTSARYACSQLHPQYAHAVLAALVRPLKAWQLAPFASRSRAGKPVSSRFAGSSALFTHYSQALVMLFATASAVCSLGARVARPIV